MSSDEDNKLKFGMSELPNDKLDIKPYDTNINVLYKLSDFIMVPTDYIYLEEDSKGEYTYSTVYGFINSKIKIGSNLEDYYQEIFERFPNLKWREIALFYYSYIEKLKENLKKEGQKERIKSNAILTDTKQVLLHINNMFDKIKEESSDWDEELKNIVDIGSLKDEFAIWDKQYKSKLKEQRHKIDKIIASQEELDDIEGVRYDEPVIESETYMYHPTLRDTGLPPTLEEGLEIFSKALVSDTVLYIQYNTEDGRNLYWVYNDIKKSKINPPSNYLTHISQSSRMNTIYVLYWIGEKDKNPNRNLIKFVYYIDTNQFILKIPTTVEGRKTIKKNLELAFRNIKFDNGEQINIYGYFEVDNISFDKLSYYYVLNTDMTHRLYLYIEESASAFADKREPNINYISLAKNKEDVKTSSVTISFGEFIAEEDEMFVNENDELVVTSNKDKTGKLRINVKSDSNTTLAKFQIVFSKLLAKYRLMKPEVEDIIHSIIPEYKQEANPGKVVDDEKKVGGKESLNKNAKRKAPDIFVSHYARVCQCGKQPLIIEPEEVPEWKEYTFIKGKHVMNRQVMPYPPLKPVNGEHDDPLTLDPYDERVRLWIVCPKNDEPYPAVKESKKLDNRDLYPYVPCCGHKDHLSKTNSKYYKYWNDEKFRGDSKKVNYNMSTMKILSPPGRKAKLGKIFPRLLSEYNTSEDDMVFSRCGVPVGVNSLIHCVLIAISDRTYNRLGNESDREIYATKVREYIANSIDPLLFRQELYDSSPEQIKADLENPEVDFSSEKYYRSLEEIFDINIFVFIVKSSDKKKNDEEEDFVLEIPRSKICHIRPYRKNRRSVIIVKHWGTEINELENPHCELIISNLEDRDDPKKIIDEEDITYIFESPMTKILYRVMLKLYQVYVWSSEEGDNNITTRINPYSRIDWETLLAKYKLVGQRIDGYGKLRVIGVKIAENKIITIFIPPSQPLNLPYLEDITRVKEKYVLDIFGKPSAIHENGLYYSVLDYKYGIYIPTIPADTLTISDIKTSTKLPKLSDERDLFSSVKNFKHNKFELDIKDGQKRVVTSGNPDPPIVENSNKNYPIDIMRIAKRNTYYLVQIIGWLKSLSEDTDIETWWKKWVVSDSEVSNKIENVIFLSVRFPSINKVKEGITYMSKIWPQFFFGDRINLYPALFDKLLAFFKNKEENPDIPKRYISSKKETKYIRATYIWEMDFFQSGNTNKLIFLNTNAIKDWIANEAKKSSRSGNQIIIQKKTNSTDLFNPNPYMYLDTSTGKVFIIQNVQSGDLDRALNVCNQWSLQVKNIGFSAESVDITSMKYIIYGISRNDKLVQVSDMSNETIDYFHIMRYTKEGRYAAMLPLR